MIAQIRISSTNLEIDDNVSKYINRKIGRLDRYLPRASRKVVRASVVLRKKDSQSDGNVYECEASLRMSDETITAKESTLNKFAAIDIVEAKLKNQLHKYKDARASEHSDGDAGKVRRRITTVKLQDK